MGTNNLILKAPQNSCLQTIVDKKILCVANLNIASGTGHLYRTLKFMKRLGNNAFLYAPNKDVLKLVTTLGFKLTIENLSIYPEDEGPWDLIILDNYQTSQIEAKRWLSLSCVIALDEGGEGRKYFPYIIDLLPALPEKGNANESDTGYLDLPPFSGQRMNPPQKILVTFGGSDQGKLTEKIGLMLDTYRLPASKWTVTKGAFFRRTFAWPGVKILQNPKIYEIVSDFDLVITHFSLTAFEAVASGANVVLFNPTSYHEKLSQIAGFSSLGLREVSKNTQKSFMNYLMGNNKDHHWYHKVVINPKKDLVKRIFQFTHQKTTCPVCSQEKEQFGTIIYRDHNKSYAECPSCKLIYQHLFTEIDPKTFQKSSDYKNLYTNNSKYLTKIAKIRIKRIMSKLHIEGRNLLEIDCNYGTFLKVAHEHGFNVRSVERNIRSAEYVRTILQLPVLEAKFPEDFTENETKYDVIVLWNVLEHFENLGSVLQKLNSLLKLGGVLAISVPQGDGMIAKYFPSQFFRKYPVDYYSIFTRKNIFKILQHYSFKVFFIRVTDVHPEHINPKLIPGKKLYNIYKYIYQMRQLGDTLEVYAIKKD